MFVNVAFAQTAPLLSDTGRIMLFSHPSIVLFLWQVASCLCFLSSGLHKSAVIILYKDSR
jgi:hypothetical protein